MTGTTDWSAMHTIGNINSTKHSLTNTYPPLDYQGNCLLYNTPQSGYDVRNTTTMSGWLLPGELLLALQSLYAWLRFILTFVSSYRAPLYDSVLSKV